MHIEHTGWHNPRAVAIFFYPKRLSINDCKYSITGLSDWRNSELGIRSNNSKGIRSNAFIAISYLFDDNTIFLLYLRRKAIFGSLLLDIISAVSSLIFNIDWKCLMSTLLPSITYSNPFAFDIDCHNILHFLLVQSKIKKFRSIIGSKIDYFIK